MTDRNLYDRALHLPIDKKAALARDHWNAFLTIIDALRDDIIEDDFTVAPKHEPVDALLAYIDEETQHISRRVDALAREAKEVAG